MYRIQSGDMLADIFSKIIGRQQFNSALTRVNLISAQYYNGPAVLSKPQEAFESEEKKKDEYATRILECRKNRHVHRTMRRNIETIMYNESFLSSY